MSSALITDKKTYGLADPGISRFGKAVRFLFL